MSPEEAEAALLCGHERGPSNGLNERVQKARAAAVARPPVDDRKPAVSSPPNQIGPYLSDFRTKTPDVFAEGWRLCTVDLERIVALQALTFTDHYSDVGELDPADIESLARVTLPLDAQVSFGIQLDQPRQAFAITSRNPHFGIGEMFFDELTFGFRIIGQKSVLKVAHYGERYLCHDGHHRVYQLLRRGIKFAPALMQNFSSFSEAAPRPGLFAEAICMGDHPPLVADLQNDQVSASVLAPETRKVMLIEARELTVPV
jgi:hypothetical protein